MTDESKERYPKTLRDEFAMTALAGILSMEPNPFQIFINADGATSGSQAVRYIAGFSYEMADAMMKARLGRDHEEK